MPYVQFTPPAMQTRQNSAVCVVSGVAVCTGQLLLTCSDFKFSVGDSPELSTIQFTPPKLSRHRQDSLVASGVAVWISFNGMALSCLQPLSVPGLAALWTVYLHCRRSFICRISCPWCHVLFPRYLGSSFLSFPGNVSGIGLSGVRNMTGPHGFGTRSSWHSHSKPYK